MSNYRSIAQRLNIQGANTYRTSFVPQSMKANKTPCTQDNTTITRVPILNLIAPLLLDNPVVVVRMEIDVNPSWLDIVVGDAVYVPAVEVTVVSKALVFTPSPEHADSELMG